MKFYHIGVWQYRYDPSTKCWWAAEYDAEGNQIGEAIDSYAKDDIIRSVKMEINAALLAAKGA